MSFAKRFSRNQSRLTAAEYGLIAALISLVIILGAGALGNALNTKLQTFGDAPTAGAQSPA
jgi:pilus assembly protein Flp/PilA